MTYEKPPNLYRHATAPLTEETLQTFSKLDTKEKSLTKATVVVRR